MGRNIPSPQSALISPRDFAPMHLITTQSHTQTWNVLTVVGVPNADNAIKVATLGVQANDFLTLQQFLPRVNKVANDLSCSWQQSQFGHPGNRHEDAATFCMKAYLDVALKIQHAQWTPGPIAFDLVYEQKVTAVKDTVLIYNRAEDQNLSWGLEKVPERKIIRTLKRGDSIQGTVGILNKQGLLEALTNPPKKEELYIKNYRENFYGVFSKENVRVTCISRQGDYIDKYFPNLPEIDWEE